MTLEEIIKIVQSNTEASWQTANIIEAIESYEQDIRAEVAEEFKYNAELFREIILEELERQAIDREEIIMYRNICSTAWNKYLEQLKERK